MNRRDINRVINTVFPVSSRIIGSPRNSLDMERYCKAFPGTTTFRNTDFPAEGSYVIPEFFAPRNIRHPYKLFIASVKKARVWGRNGAVIGDRDYFITDVSREFDEGKNVNHSVFYTIRQVKPEVLKGKSAVIGTAGAYVYFHWMLDVLPRLSLLAQEINLEDIDHFISEYNGFDFQKETLKRLNIPETKVVVSNENWNFHVIADTLYVPSLAGPIGQPNLFQITCLRNMYYDEMYRGEGFKKIYISRRLSGRRTITNENEIISHLEYLGFEILDCENLSVLEQVKVFSEASVVIGSHGSAFTNLVFCNKGTKVLDIFNESHTNPCFWIISKILELDYHLLQGESVPIDHNPKSDNTQVNLQFFLTTIKQMGIL